MLERLRRELESKRARLRDLTEAHETRDMTADESAAFDSLLDEVATLKARVDKLEAAEAGEAAEVEAEAEANRSRGRRSAPIQRGPSIHLDRDRRPYSYLRAFRRAADLQACPDGLEGEISQEISRRTGIAPRTLFLPLGNDPEIRSLMNRGRTERRDLTTATGAGAIFELPGGSLIDVLRNKLVLRAMGMRVLSDAHGLFAIPRKNMTSQVNWLAEGVNGNTSGMSFDQVPFSPKLALVATGLTRLFLAQTSEDAEQLVRDDLAASMAVELDRVAINGLGGTQPLGLLQRSNVPVIPIGPNGGPPTWGTVINLESSVAILNADVGKLGYITNSAMRGTLKQTPVSFAGNANVLPAPIWQNGSTEGTGELNGYKAMVTNSVPSNLQKGNSAAVLSAILYGNWDDSVMALWEGVDTLVNPFSPQMSAGVVISMNMCADFNIRHNESFAVCVDAQKAA